MDSWCNSPIRAWRLPPRHFKLTSTDDLGHAITVLGREALLREAVLVVSPVEAFGEHAGEVIHRLAALPVPLVLTGAATWDPEWCDVVPLLTEVSRLTVAERHQLWRNELGSLADTVGVGDIAAQLAFGPRQVAAKSAAEAVARLAQAHWVRPNYGTAPGRRPRPAWNGWPGGSNRRCRGRTSCCRCGCWRSCGG